MNTSADLTTTNNNPCPICGGLGIITLDVPMNDPRFGKAFPCTCQADKRRQQRVESLRKMGNLEAYTHKRFDTFQIDYTSADAELKTVFPDMDDVRRSPLDDTQRSQINAAAELAYVFAIGAEQVKPWLLLKGTYGTGKTHLAAAIANFRIEHGEPVLFITTPDLLDHLRSTFGPSSEVAYDETFDQVRNAAMLVLDDLGAESPTPWAQEKLYQLISYRHAKRLPTVITTNVEIEAFDPRVRSRLLDDSLTQILQLEVPDRRSSALTWQHMDLTRLDRHAGKRFDTFDLRTDENLVERHVQLLAHTVKVAQAFVNNPSRWLVLTGEPASGKTHLAAAIAFDCNRQGKKTLFVTVSDLLDHLRSTFAPGSSVKFDRRMEEIRNAEILVLDDLSIDSRAVSSWAYQKLYDILLYRFDYNLPTVITTSQPLQDMDVRLRSRLINKDYCVVEAITVPAYQGRSPKRRTAAPPRSPRS